MIVPWWHALIFVACVQVVWVPKLLEWWASRA
jgi:hypothetical protein